MQYRLCGRGDVTAQDVRCLAVYFWTLVLVQIVDDAACDCRDFMNCCLDTQSKHRGFNSQVRSGGDIRQLSSPRQHSGSDANPDHFSPASPRSYLLPGITKIRHHDM